MSTMSRIFTAIILFIEIKSISSLTGFEIRAQQQSPQVYQEGNNGPTLTFNGGFPGQGQGQSPPFNPNIPQQQGVSPPYQRPIHNTLVFHNSNNYQPVPATGNPGQSPPFNPDIPSAQGPPIFTFNPNAQPPYQPPVGNIGPNPNPADPQPQAAIPVAPKAPGVAAQDNGPIINAAQSSGQEVFIQHGQIERDTFLYSTHAQIIIGTLAAFCGFCVLIRCYSNCCWDKPGHGLRKRSTMAHDAYSRGAAVTRQTTTIEADIDWSDHTENEDDPLDDDSYDDNVLTDVQQMKSRKARELVPDESIDSGIYSNVDDRLDINQADVEILMEEEDDQNNDNHPLTDDETKAIMREFKDTDDEYVD